MSLVLALLSAQVGVARAESGLPAPQPGDSSEACKDDFTPLRDEVERRGKLIREASARHAPTAETCKLIGAYSQAEIKMIKYVETNAQHCAIQLPFVEQVKKSHKTTEALEMKVCDAAQQMQHQGPPASFNDFGDPALQNGGRPER